MKQCASDMRVNPSCVSRGVATREVINKMFCKMANGELGLSNTKRLKSKVPSLLGEVYENLRRQLVQRRIETVCVCVW